MPWQYTFTIYLISPYVLKAKGKGKVWLFMTRKGVGYLEPYTKVINIVCVNSHPSRSQKHSGFGTATQSTLSLIMAPQKINSLLHLVV